MFKEWHIIYFEYKISQKWFNKTQLPTSSILSLIICITMVLNHI